MRRSAAVFARQRRARGTQQDPPVPRNGVRVGSGVGRQSGAECKSGGERSSGGGRHIDSAVKLKRREAAVHEDRPEEEDIAVRAQAVAVKSIQKGTVAVAQQARGGAPRV